MSSSLDGLSALLQLSPHVRTTAENVARVARWLGLAAEGVAPVRVSGAFLRIAVSVEPVRVEVEDSAGAAFGALLAETLRQPTLGAFRDALRFLATLDRLSTPTSNLFSTYSAVAALFGDCAGASPQDTCGQLVPATTATVAYYEANHWLNQQSLLLHNDTYTLLLDVVALAAYPLPDSSAGFSLTLSPPVHLPELLLMSWGNHYTVAPTARHSDYLARLSHANFIEHTIRVEDHKVHLHMAYLYDGLRLVPVERLEVRVPTGAAFQPWLAATIGHLRNWILVGNLLGNVGLSSRVLEAREEDAAVVEPVPTTLADFLEDAAAVLPKEESAFAMEVDEVDEVALPGPDFCQFTVLDQPAGGLPEVRLKAKLKTGGLAALWQLRVTNGRIEESVPEGDAVVGAEARVRFVKMLDVTERLVDVLGSDRV